MQTNCLENNWGPQMNNFLSFQLMLLTCMSIWWHVSASADHHWKA